MISKGFEGEGSLVRTGRLIYATLDQGCHARIPVLPEWLIRTEFGARDYILGLIDLFFIRAEIVLVGIQTISVITKII